MKEFITCLALLLFPAILPAQPGYIDVYAPSSSRQIKLVVDAPISQGTVPATAAAKEMGTVIAYDMNMTGIFAAETRDQLSPSPSRSFPLAETDFMLWINAGYDILVRSEYNITGNDLTVEFRLFDIPNRKMMTAMRYLGKTGDLRRFAHSFGDEILQVMTGEKGCFTTHIAFVSTRTGNKEIAFMDWDGHNQLQLTRNGSINLNPDFSPDGREIIITSYKRGNPDLYERFLSSSTELLLSNRKGLNITGAWSPDGTRIALALSKDGDAEIYTIASDGSKPVRLTVNPTVEISPTWSPDGSRIAFVSDRLGKPQIFVMNAVGGTARRLTTNGDFNVTPRWSPKGDKIAYARREGSSFQIHTIKTDGSGQTRISKGRGNETQPAWQPR